MALAVCLLFEEESERALRGLWRRIESAGVPSMASHTHGRHVPHLSYAVLRSFDVETVRSAVQELPPGAPLPVHLEAVATVARGRVWLVPAPAEALLRRQQGVAEAVTAAGAELHRHYRVGRWLPHVSLAPRARLQDLPAVAEAANAVLPLAATATRAALIDSATGQRWALPGLP